MYEQEFIYRLTNDLWLWLELIINVYVNVHVQFYLIIALGPRLIPPCLTISYRKWSS